MIAYRVTSADRQTCLVSALDARSALAAARAANSLATFVSVAPMATTGGWKR